MHPTTIVRIRTVYKRAKLRAVTTRLDCLDYQEPPDLKLFGIVLTLIDNHSRVRVHNKQGGPGRHILPD